MKWITDQASLRDFISLMIVHAPDFPTIPNLEPHEQMTIERAFVELRAAVALMPQLEDEERKAEAIEQLTQAESAFKENDLRTAIARLQRLQLDWFGGPGAPGLHDG